MNAEIKRFWELNRMYSQLRDELMNILTDEDLAFNPGGGNPTLGELCRELGETEYAYARSYASFTIDFSYRADDEQLARSVEKLKVWYAQLDSELQAALEALSDDDVAGKEMERGGFRVPLPISLDIYREALLIFYGKVDVYAKAMGKPLTPMWRDWIA